MDRILRVITEIGREKVSTALFMTLNGLIVLMAHAPVPAMAQGTRAELIARQQEEKSEHLGVEGPSRAERFSEWVERSPLFGRTSGWYPWAGSIYPAAGPGVGAGWIRRGGNGARVNAVAGATVGGSSVIRADGRLPELAGGRIETTLDAGWFRAKDLEFYGLGPDSPAASLLRYDYRPAAFGTTVSLRPVRPVALTARYERLLSRTETRDPTTATDAPGAGESLSYDVARAGLALDWRTSPGYSTRGGLQRVTWSWYSESEGRPFDFRQLEYEGVQLVPLVREQFVLAGRVLATLTHTDGGNEVPLTLAPTLGGGGTLRGFTTRRFTDRNRLLLTGEYRWRPSRSLDMVAFADAGKVGARREDLGLRGLETDWGIGARAHGPRAAGVTFEVAKGREGWKVLLVGGL